VGRVSEVLGALFQQGTDFIIVWGRVSLPEQNLSVVGPYSYLL
jgi:hypothetical protein